MANKYIYELPQLFTLSDGLKLPAYDVVTDTTYHFDLSLLGFSGNPADFLWNPDDEFAEGAIVTWSQGPGQPLQVWVSEADANQGNVPGPGSLFWSPGTSQRSGFVPWQAGIYLDDYPTVVHNNIIYWLDESVPRPYNSVDIDAEIIAGDWVALGGGGGGITNASNGLTNDAGTVKLGGHVTEDVLIQQDFGISLSIEAGENAVTPYALLYLEANNGFIVATQDSAGLLQTQLSIGASFAGFYDSRTETKGLQYAADYSAFFDDRSIPDVAWVLANAAGFTSAGSGLTNFGGGRIDLGGSLENDIGGEAFFSWDDMVGGGDSGTFSYGVGGGLQFHRDHSDGEGDFSMATHFSWSVEDLLGNSSSMSALNNGDSEFTFLVDGSHMGKFGSSALGEYAYLYLQDIVAAKTIGVYARKTGLELTAPGLPISLDSTIVLPSLGAAAPVGGGVRFYDDGVGTPTLAVSDGTDWYNVTTGAVI